MEIAKLQALAKLVRYYSLVSSSTAGSGHPTSSLSAADLMTVLLFSGFFRFDFDKPQDLSNDRLIFSKGHASPLYYSLFLAADQITETEIKSLRRLDSPLEGHPTPRFKFTEAATGSLGQGLSIGFGMALAIRKHYKNLPSLKSLPRVFVLLGDGEMAEGSVWEAVNLASYYKLNNLTAILDVNRLGQSQETMLGWETQVYEKRFKAFGWETIVIDGHDLNQISQAFQKIRSSTVKQPTVIIAKTVKGKGVSFIENKDGWHGKPLPADDLVKALKELGEVDINLRGEVSKPDLRIKSRLTGTASNYKLRTINYQLGDQVATRKAYGNALARLGEKYPQLVSLDGDVKNSTYAEIFKEKFPGRFFEMFIAEQNMVGAAVGFAKLGYVPFVSTFAAFLTRAYDQIRMAAVSGANIKICGSHAGVSIGEDGPSQMGLEDLAMFRAVNGSTVLYPADAVATEKLVEEMIKREGICYLRTSRPATPVIYDNNENFPIGGSKVHNPKYQIPNTKYQILLISAGITLFEALKAQEELAKKGIGATVVDCYSVKPIDSKTLSSLARAALANDVGTAQVITVEDHWFEGGLGDAVLNVFASDPNVKITKLAVSKMPRSGKPAELLALEGIDAKAIIKAVQTL